jgi:hypothetical protein
MILNGFEGFAHKPRKIAGSSSAVIAPIGCDSHFDGIYVQSRF